jgi:hypothetical protein
MRFSPPTLLAILALAVVSHAANPLPNPGFEEGIQHWTISDRMTSTTAEAAHEGKLGLHIVDDDAVNGSSALSSRLPVKAGQEVGLSFQARTEEDFSAVYLWFFDAAGKVIKDPAEKAGGGMPMCPVKKTDGHWNAYALTGKAPTGAESVGIWIHTFSTTRGTLDLDDFALTGIEEGAAPIFAKVGKAPALVVVPTVMPPRAKPPVIIIKVDDLRQVKGRVPPLWDRFAKFIEARGLHASIGIICHTLEEATPEYIQWIKAQRDSGRIEFWFHGWTHDTRTEDGLPYNEFDHRPFEDQLDRFARSQQQAQEKLGFVFNTFGPPGGGGPRGFDDTTVRVMGAEPNMKIWLYPMPIDERGRKLQAAGKVTILDRVFDVNIESQVGLPDYARLVAGFAKHPDRDYFVIQGHTAQWGAPGRFEEFEKIIDFLIAQHAVFMTPTEFVASKTPAKK